MGGLIQIHIVANRLSCTKKFVYSLIQDGKLTAIRLGPRGLRVKEDSLNQFIRENEVRPEEFGQ